MEDRGRNKDTGTGIKTLDSFLRFFYSSGNSPLNRQRFTYRGEISLRKNKRAVMSNVLRQERPGADKDVARHRGEDKRKEVDEKRSGTSYGRPRTSV